MVSRLNTLTALIRSNCGGSSSGKNSFQADQILAVATSWWTAYSSCHLLFEPKNPDSNRIQVRQLKL